METGVKELSAPRLVLVALVAVLGFAVLGGSNAIAGGDEQAVAAKKKCKKGKKSAVTAKKKKKCKRAQLLLPAPAPLVRATLSWSAFNEVDLHAYDASGNHAGWSQPNSSGTLVQNIPNAHHSGDSGGPTGGTESFTDDIYVLGGPSNREFSYIACLYEFTSGADYTATFTAVSKSGTPITRELQGTPGVGGRDAYVITPPGGPPVPSVSSVC